VAEYAHTIRGRAFILRLNHDGVAFLDAVATFAHGYLVDLPVHAPFAFPRNGARRIVSGIHASNQDHPATEFARVTNSRMTGIRDATQSPGFPHVGGYSAVPRLRE